MLTWRPRRCLTHGRARYRRPSVFWGCGASPFLPFLQGGGSGRAWRKPTPGLLTGFPHPTHPASHRFLRNEEGRDRSATWRHFRSTRGQRAWWLDRVRRDRRVRPHRSVRGKMRGMVPDPRCGVAKFAADGPGRLSTSVSRACWTGPPPSRSPRAATGHDRLARLSRRSPSGGAACGFWIRAWSHASPLFKQPDARAARYYHRAFSRVGWTIPFPITRKATHVRSNACCGH